MRGTWLVVLLFGLGAGTSVRGQNAPASADRPYAGLRRWEVAGQTADIRTNCVGQSHPCYVPSFGLGAQATANLTPGLALDADFLITAASSGGESDQFGGRASEILAGARLEVRGRRYGYFAKAEAGSFAWSRVITSTTFIPQPPYFQFQVGPTHSFASEVGLGFEYSLSDRLHARAEVGDLILRHTVSGFPGSAWLNNLQPSIGLAYGLGKPLRWTPPVYDARKTHPFFGRTNILLLTASALADTADSITTQRFIARGAVEGDPFARPLVKYGWSGQIAAMALETTGEVGGMYGFHRIGRHWFERLVPVGVAAVHGYFAYENTKVPGHPQGSVP